MSPLKILALIYAAIILVLGLLAAADSASLNYPAIFVLSTTLTAIAIPTGVYSIATKWHPLWVKEHWPKVFIFCVADTVIGLVMDAFIPTDYSLLTDGINWIEGAIFLHALLLPGFYLNYKLAFPNKRRDNS